MAYILYGSELGFCRSRRLVLCRNAVGSDDAYRAAHLQCGDFAEPMSPLGEKASEENHVKSANAATLASLPLRRSVVVGMLELCLGGANIAHHLRERSRFDRQPGQSGKPVVNRGARTEPSTQRRNFARELDGCFTVKSRS